MRSNLLGITQFVFFSASEGILITLFCEFIKLEENIYGIISRYLYRSPHNILVDIASRGWVNVMWNISLFRIHTWNFLSKILKG